MAILVHQFEEYRWPGYFAGLFNVVIFKSDIPDRYPLNTQSAMVINILIAYVFLFTSGFLSKHNMAWFGTFFYGFFSIHMAWYFLRI